MPGLSGLQVATEIRKMNNDKNVVIVLVSADYVYEADGVVNYILEKPLNLNKIKELYLDMKKENIVHKNRVSNPQTKVIDEITNENHTSISNRNENQIRTESMGNVNQVK